MFNILAQWMHSVRDSVTVCCVKAINEKRMRLFDHVIGPYTGQIPPKKTANGPPHDRTATKIVQRMVWLYEKNFYHDLLILETVCIQ